MADAADNCQWWGGAGEPLVVSDECLAIGKDGEDQQRPTAM
jgi:hypothetical protein